MGAFVLITDTAKPDPDTVAAVAHRATMRQGFAEPSVLRFGGGTLYMYPKQVAPVVSLLALEDDEFCAASGTFVYKAATAERGLRAIHADFDIGATNGSYGLDMDRLHGAFCVVLRKRGRTYLFLDRIGVYKVYVNADATLFSSSFLTLLESSSRRRIDIQALYEYVFQGATYGGDTLAEDIKLVDPDFICQPGVALRSVPRQRFDAAEVVRRDIDWHVEQVFQTLKRSFADIANAFGGHIDTALSGGYDSRLMLALLIGQNVRPDVHVYGRDTDADVRIAKAVAAAERFPIVHIQKSALADVRPDEAGETIARTFYAFDGVPNDGIFDNGSDLATRRDRCRTGALMLNGGGGEVLRNFFYLPDRTLSVRQVLWSFYSQFDPATATGDFNEADFHAVLGDKLKAALGVQTDRLTRAQVELAYPLFRCRFWMGRNNSLNSRFGSALTPFVDDALVRQAAQVPLAYKNVGVFEARLITLASPALAAYLSEYGYSFDRLPPLSARLKATITNWRPPLLRRYVFRIRNRRRLAALPPVLSQAIRDRVMKPGFPRSGALFNPARLTDPGQFNRLCTAEYLFQTMDLALPSRSTRNRAGGRRQKKVPAGT